MEQAEDTTPWHLVRLVREEAGWNILYGRSSEEAPESIITSRSMAHESSHDLSFDKDDPDQGVTLIGQWVASSVRSHWHLNCDPATVLSQKAECFDNEGNAHSRLIERLDAQFVGFDGVSGMPVVAVPNMVLRDSDDDDEDDEETSIIHEKVLPQDQCDNDRLTSPEYRRPQRRPTQSKSSERDTGTSDKNGSAPLCNVFKYKTIDDMMDCSSPIVWRAEYFAPGAISHVKNVLYMSDHHEAGDIYQDKGLEYNYGTIEQLQANGVPLPPFKDDEFRGAPNQKAEAFIGNSTFQYEAWYVESLILPVRMSDIITRICKTLTTHGYRILKSAALHGFLLFYDLFCKEIGTRKRLARANSSGITLPRCILMYEHWIRWHEIEHAGMYMDPREWMRLRTSNISLPIMLDLELTLGEVSDIVNQIQPKLPWLPTTSRHVMLPQFMPGSRLGRFAPSVGMGDRKYTAPCRTEKILLGFDHVYMYGGPKDAVMDGSMFLAIPARLSHLYYNVKELVHYEDGLRLGKEFLGYLDAAVESQIPTSNGGPSCRSFGSSHIELPAHLCSPSAYRRISRVDLEDVTQMLENRPKLSHVQWSLFLCTLQEDSDVLDNCLPLIREVIQHIDRAMTAHYKDSNRLRNLVLQYNQGGLVSHEFAGQYLLSWVPQTLSRLAGSQVTDAAMGDPEDLNLCENGLGSFRAQNNDAKVIMLEVVLNLTKSCIKTDTNTQNNSLSEAMVNVEKAMRSLCLDSPDTYGFARSMRARLMERIADEVSSMASQQC